MTKPADRRTLITRSSWARDAYEHGYKTARTSPVVGLDHQVRHYEAMSTVTAVDAERVRLALSDLDGLAAAFTLVGDTVSHDAVMLARKVVSDVLGPKVSA